MRVVLADRQSSTRSALRILIRAQEDLSLVGEASNAAELLSAIEATAPDLVVFDFDDFDQAVEDVLDSLREVLPSTAVVGMSIRTADCQLALSHGADDFVYKGDPPKRLLEAVRRLKKPR
jgi:DNA-binding NarL/FixJ family response regulator